MVISNAIEEKTSRIKLGKTVLVAPLRLELLENDNYYDRNQSLSTTNLSFNELSHRGISSAESLEYQDKYVTPPVLTDDESDIERAKIVEEAALVAEKLMSSQLSKITYESELRTMETRFPTRVNSPRYYSGKKEVMDRANRMLMNKGSNCSIPGFLQDKFGWFNCVENFFSACNDEQIIEENESNGVIEASPYFSPKKRSSMDKNMIILEGLKALNKKEEKIIHSKVDGRKLVKKISNTDDQMKDEGNGAKTQSSKRLVNSDKDSTVIKEKTNNNSVDTKKTQVKELNKSSKPKNEISKYKEVISESNSYDIENDVFYLDDGAGYITFNASKLDLSEMEKRFKPQKVGNKSEKNSNKMKSSNSSPKNSDAENQKVSTSSIVNMNSETVKKSPTRCKAHLSKNKQTNSMVSETVQNQISSSSSKKECKKKVKAQKIENYLEFGGAKGENSYFNSEQNILNYSTNCIRGRMDYISTDVFV
ncbi:uncharacterized protein cubi_03407 [Cryptosporidium ubiquitum]|uniref:Uncharacterized protein n=1 Tax=Cryptosporidium ubiquitum TaxID=857276 RepID=A0A1J4MH93_9CRYT|nr:uncharacterized protein cubi_03407 [Cryptosporidium ubiquitum]OII73609.1 hypothetical protein cubi_03407 [Cryptosporidium ubiquitum]